MFRLLKIIGICLSLGFLGFSARSEAVESALRHGEVTGNPRKPTETHEPDVSKNGYVRLIPDSKNTTVDPGASQLPPEILAKLNAEELAHRHA